MTLLVRSLVVYSTQEDDMSIDNFINPSELYFDQDILIEVKEKFYDIFE